MGKFDCTRIASPVKSTKQNFAQLPVAITRDGTIPPSWKAVMLALASYAYADRPSCWPSTKSLSEAVGLDPGHVRRILRGLIARKLIARAPLLRDDTPLRRQFFLLWKAGAEESYRRALEAGARRAQAPTEVFESGKIENPASVGTVAKPPPPAEAGIDLAAILDRVGPRDPFARLCASVAGAGADQLSPLARERGGPRSIVSYSRCQFAENA